MDGFFEVWPRGKILPQKTGQMKIAFGDPVFPPDESIPPEDAYEQMMSEVRRRVVTMFDQLRNSGERPQSRAAAAD